MKESSWKECVGRRRSDSPMSRVDESTVDFLWCWTVLTAAEGDEKDWKSLENGRGKDRNWDGKWKLVATQLGMRKGGEASFYTGGAGGTRDKVGFEAGG